MRASAGSALRLPIVAGISATILLAQLRISRAKIYAAVAEESQNSGRGGDAPFLAPWDVDWKAAAAILIGNEGAGLPAELVRAADARIYIPQSAGAARVGIESLNAAMAASVLLYEAMRQRNAARRRTS
jgi:TrmH family RNA methyltransferase